MTAPEWAGVTSKPAAGVTAPECDGECDGEYDDEYDEYDLQELEEEDHEDVIEVYDESGTLVGTYTDAEWSRLKKSELQRSV